MATAGFRPLVTLFSYNYYSAAPVGSPRNISIDVVGSMAISVTWEPPLAEDQNGFIASYVIQLYNTVTGQTVLYRREGHHSQFVIDTLHPYYEYDVSIAAETVAIGPFSTPQRVLTLEDCKPPTYISTHQYTLLMSGLLPLVYLLFSILQFLVQLHTT